MLLNACSLNSAGDLIYLTSLTVSSGRRREKTNALPLQEWSDSFSKIATIIDY